jgi:hypothetical protein
MARSIAAPIGIIVACLFLLWQTFAMTSAYSASELFGPAFFPRFVLGALIFVSALQIGQEAMRRRPAAPESVGARPDPIAFAATLAAAVAYVVAMQYLGFLPATLAFQAAIFSLVFGMRNLRGIVLLPALLTTGYFVIFLRLLELPLPQGHWVFRDLSRFLYY